MKRELFKYPHEFTTEGGYTFNNIEICYHISEDFDICPQKEVIWITHALTANSDPSDWWDILVGEGKLFDTQKYVVVCANLLGSCYGSTGPSTIMENGKPLLLNFPKLTIRDIVKAHELLARHLNIKTINLLVGGSVGGFQAIEWAYSSSVEIKKLALIATNARISPWGIAFNESQRMALNADPTFTASQSVDGGKAGLAAARSIALISYRSYHGYCTSQCDTDQDSLFEHKSISYQQYQGKKLADRFDAYSYLCMINLTDSHNLVRGRGGVAKALATISIPTICVGIDSDYLFPVQELKEIAELLPAGEYKEITSLFGHDGFLLEKEQLQDVLGNFYNDNK